MTEESLKRIEGGLAISLPAEYRALGLIDAGASSLPTSAKVR